MKLQGVELLRQQVGDVTRRLVVYPSYDLRPRVGVHAAEMAFVVEGGGCTVVWQFDTHWWIKGLRAEPGLQRMLADPTDGTGAISFHSPVPTAVEEEPGVEDCQYTGGPCYGGSTYVSSNLLFDKFVLAPGEVWVELESKLAEVRKWVKEQQEMERKFS